MSSPAASTAQVLLKSNRTGPFFARHPWVLDSSIAQVDGEPQDGDVVDLLTQKGQFVARGTYNAHSRIRVRLYTWRQDEPLDDAFWQRRIGTALELRRRLAYTDPDGAARLVFSEADGLSGLIVDRFAGDLVVQLTAQAMHRRLDLIAGLLKTATGCERIFVRTDTSIARAEGLDVRDGLYWGTPRETELLIREHGLSYRVDPGEGQKTGFYLDQRENRRAAARYAAGARVLDMCCYTGGFGLTAASVGGAREVLAYDSSNKAVEMAQQNAARNGVENIRFEVGDVFEGLERLAAEGKMFDLVILDPPRFAGNRKHLDAALRAYHRLNKLAFAVLEPGGTLVTCSCSGHVTQADFFNMLVGVAQKTKRELQILEERGAAPDHPVLVSCPESEYLKCFICRVL